MTQNELRDRIKEERLDGVFLFSCPVCPGKQNILASLLQKIERTRERGIFLLYGIFIPSEEPDAQGGAECEH